MIEYLKSKYLLSYYAFVIEPTDDEERELTDNGYTYFAGYIIEDKENEHYGKRCEMWVNYLSDAIKKKFSTAKDNEEDETFDRAIDALLSCHTGEENEKRG